MPAQPQPLSALQLTAAIGALHALLDAANLSDEDADTLIAVALPLLQRRSGLESKTFCTIARAANRAHALRPG